MKIRGLKSGSQLASKLNSSWTLLTLEQTYRPSHFIGKGLHNEDDNNDDDDDVWMS